MNSIAKYQKFIFLYKPFIRSICIPLPDTSADTSSNIDFQGTDRSSGIDLTCCCVCSPDICDNDHTTCHRKCDDCPGPGKRLY